MKEASWNDCIYSNSAVKVTPDKEKAKSLIEIAEDRIKFSIRDLDEKTANYIFEDYYSSILELAQALVILDGYKINNHVCFGFFLRDVLKKEDLFRLFDNCRYKRNSLIYYGKRMDFNTAKDAMEKAKRLMNKLKNINYEKLKNK